MHSNTRSPLLGAHMSIAGGLELAYQRGESIGCTAIQIFTKSNRQWHASSLTHEAIQQFLTTQQTSSVHSIIAHASYLINIGAQDAVIHKKSINALAQELERCHALRIPALVVHPGSRGTSDEGVCLNKISDALNTVLEKSHGTTKILLENMAGQGSAVCYTFEHLGHILKQSDFKAKLGVCIDTCHAFAAGYSFNTAASYKAMWQEFDESIGLKKLHAIHVNDSKKELGSRVDRHEDIGKGKIGLMAFELLVNDPQLDHIPKILETPQATLEDYAKNLKVLRSLIA